MLVVPQLLVGPHVFIFTSMATLKRRKHQIFTHCLSKSSARDAQKGYIFSHLVGTLDHWGMNKSCIAFLVITTALVMEGVKEIHGEIQYLFTGSSV